MGFSQNKEKTRQNILTEQTVFVIFLTIIQKIAVLSITSEYSHQSGRENPARVFFIR